MIFKITFFISVKEDESSSEDEDDSVGGIFSRTSHPKTKTGLQSKRALMDDTDTSLFIPHSLRDWDAEEVFFYVFIIPDEGRSFCLNELVRFYKTFQNL